MRDERAHLNIEHAGAMPTWPKPECARYRRDSGIVEVNRSTVYHSEESGCESLEMANLVRDVSASTFQKEK
jgi:hypothetical protein